MTNVTREYDFGGYKFEVPIASRLDLLCKELKLEFPKLKMAHKRTCWWHWVAHVFLCVVSVGFIRNYISSRTTTGKNHIAWSDVQDERLKNGKNLDGVWETLRHEREHLRQFKKYGRFLMYVLYISFPPILFAWGRALLIEKPAFLEELRARYERMPNYVQADYYKNQWIKHFTGPAYLWMWILRKQVSDWYDDELEKLLPRTE